MESVGTIDRAVNSHERDADDMLLERLAEAMGVPLAALEALVRRRAAGIPDPR